MINWGLLMINAFYKNYLWIIALLTGLQSNSYANQTVNIKAAIFTELIIQQLGLELETLEIPTDAQIKDALLNSIESIRFPLADLYLETRLKIALNNLKEDSIFLQDLVDIAVFGNQLSDIYYDINFGEVDKKLKTDFSITSLNISLIYKTFKDVSTILISEPSISNAQIQNFKQLYILLKKYPGIARSYAYYLEKEIKRANDLEFYTICGALGCMLGGLAAMAYYEIPFNV